MKVKLTELDLEGNGTVTGLKAPTNNTDSATKKYVDDKVKEIMDILDELEIGEGVSF